MTSLLCGAAVLAAVGCNNSGLGGETPDGSVDLSTSGPTVDLALPAPDGGGVIGSDCITADSSLGPGNCLAGSYCLTESDGYPGGICIVECSDELPCPTGSVCAGTNIAGASGCFPACKVDKDCRKGYSCSTRTGACRPNAGGVPQLPPGLTETGDACVVPPTNPPMSPWEAPKPLVAQGHYSTATQVAYDAVGKRLVSVWYDFSQQSDSISYAMSLDGGATFSNAAQLKRDNGNGQTDYVDLPITAVDPSGAVYVAWLGYTANADGTAIDKMNVFVARSATGAATIEPVGRPTPSAEFDPAGGLGGPFLSASPKDGTLAVTWTQITATQERNIRLSLSTDQGATWSAPKTISETSARATNTRGRARSAFGADGSLYVVWLEYLDLQFGSTANAIYLQKLDAAGNLVGANREITSDTDSPGYETMSLVASGTTVALAYGNGDDTGAWDVRLLYSLDSGATFQPSLKLNDDATCATHFRPTLAFDGKGVLHAVFYDNRYQTGNVFHTTVTFGSGAPVVAANDRVSPVGFRFSTSAQGFSVLSDYLGLAATDTGLFATYTAPAPMMPPVPVIAKLPFAVVAQPDMTPVETPDMGVETPSDM